MKEICGGIFHHFGLRIEIDQLCKVYDTQKIPSTLMLVVGIDGLPIPKNPPSRLWPCLGYFSNLGKSLNMFVIGAYYGQLKPQNSYEFLSDLVDEFNLFIRLVLILIILIFKFD